MRPEHSGVLLRSRNSSIKKYRSEKIFIKNVEKTIKDRKVFMISGKDDHGNRSNSTNKICETIQVVKLVETQNKFTDKRKN